MLTNEEIDAKIAVVQEHFDRVQKTKDEADAELYRLQGEYRALTAMKTPDPATTIEAKPEKATAK